MPRYHYLDHAMSATECRDRRDRTMAESNRHEGHDEDPYAPATGILVGALFGFALWMAIAMLFYF